MRQLTMWRLGGGCNRNRCDGGDDCPCRRKLRPQPCGCPAVVDRLKGAHLEGCPYNSAGRFYQERNHRCDKCGAKRGHPCRTTKGKRIGRSVSYSHRRRVERWWEEKKL